MLCTTKLKIKQKQTRGVSKKLGARFKRKRKKIDVDNFIDLKTSLHQTEHTFENIFV